MSDERFESLQKRFVARCKAERRQIAALVDRDDLASGELERLVHSLAGAAGTFGFPLLSQAADQIDETCRQDQRPTRQDLAVLLDQLMIVSDPVSRRPR